MPGRTAGASGPGRGKNTPALWALVTGIGGFVLFPLVFLTAIAAIVLGAVGLKKAQETGTGKGQAGWGLGLGIAQLIVVPIILLAFGVFALIDFIGDQADLATMVPYEDGDPGEELGIYITILEDGDTIACDCRVTVELEGPRGWRTVYDDDLTVDDFAFHDDAPRDGYAAFLVVQDPAVPCADVEGYRLTVVETYGEEMSTRSASCG